MVNCLTQHAYDTSKQFNYERLIECVLRSLSINAGVNNAFRTIN